MQPPPVRGLDGVARWAGGAASAGGLVLAGLALAFPSPALQQVLGALLALLLIGMLALSVDALRKALGQHDQPTWLWALLGGALVVALALGFVGGLML
jgi:hypothetical protein